MEAPWLRRMPMETLNWLRLPWLPDSCTELRNKACSVSLQRGNKGAPEEEGPLTLRWAELRFTVAFHLSLPFAPYSFISHFFTWGTLHSMNTMWGPSLSFRSTQNHRDGKDTCSQVRKIWFFFWVYLGGRCCFVLIAKSSTETNTELELCGEQNLRAVSSGQEGYVTLGKRVHFSTELLMASSVPAAGNAEPSLKWFHFWWRWKVALHYISCPAGEKSPVAHCWCIHSVALLSQSFQHVIHMYSLQVMTEKLISKTMSGNSSICAVWGGFCFFFFLFLGGVHWMSITAEPGKAVVATGV